MTRPVTVQYYKQPDTLHWRHDLVYLGSDEHGTWLGAPAGTVLQRGHEDPIEHGDVFVQLIRDGWWTAIFNDTHNIAIYVDLVTPPRWLGDDRVEMVDLDLDVVQRRDGSAYIDDEDEFEEHRFSLGYSAATVDMARTTAARVLLAIEAGDPPFVGSAAPWLAMVR